MIKGVYHNISTIESYRVSLDYSIYANTESTCNKNDTSIKMINSADDIWLCFDSFYLLACNQLWQLVSKCGTFIEVHRPFDDAILSSFNLEEVSWVMDENGVKIINMDVSRLCGGTYHLWLVYYSRMGKFLKGVEVIYITFPSCHT